MFKTFQKNGKKLIYISFFKRVGETYNGFTLQPDLALPIFYRLLGEMGVCLMKKRVNSMSELSNYDYVINCCGAGAKHLVGDCNIEPTSGHVLRVKVRINE
jgi:hypothetical protein